MDSLFRSLHFTYPSQRRMECTNSSGCTQDSTPYASPFDSFFFLFSFLHFWTTIWRDKIDQFSSRYFVSNKNNQRKDFIDAPLGADDALEFQEFIAWNRLIRCEWKVFNRKMTICTCLSAFDESKFSTSEWISAFSVIIFMTPVKPKIKMWQLPLLSDVQQKNIFPTKMGKDEEWNCVGQNMFCKVLMEFRRTTTRAPLFA